jgi:hypothetical protein
MGKWLRDNGLAEISPQERYRALQAEPAGDHGLAQQIAQSQAAMLQPSRRMLAWVATILRLGEEGDRRAAADRAPRPARSWRRRERARRCMPQAAFRRAHEAMLDSHSTDLLVLARCALQGAIRNEADLLELLDDAPAALSGGGHAMVLETA